MPGRHAIDGKQELNYRAIAKADANADFGFRGWVSHEFAQAHDPIASLRQAFEICDESGQRAVPIRDGGCLRGRNP